MPSLEEIASAAQILVSDRARENFLLLFIIYSVSRLMLVIPPLLTALLGKYRKVTIEKWGKKIILEEGEDELRPTRSLPPNDH